MLHITIPKLPDTLSYSVLAALAVEALLVILLAVRGVVLLFAAALIDLLATHPYGGLLFMLAAILLGFVFVLLQQGGVPAELRIGGVTAIGAPSRRALLRMLEELRDSGLLTKDEFIAKRALFTR
jgi:hypothetical protein